MIRTFGLFTAMAGALALTIPSDAATISMPDNGARYVFQKAGDGFARMDKQTGEVSYCRMEAPAGLVCRVAPDDRRAYEKEIANLARENAELKGGLGTRGLGATPSAPVPQTRKQADAAEQIDLVEFIMKRMIHAARDVASEVDAALPPDPSPDTP